MVYQVQVFPLDNGGIAIGFALARTLVTVVPSAVDDLVGAVVGGVSSSRASLEQITHGPHKGRWILTILGTVLRMDECDVTALRSELRKVLTH
jgi:hypothetical protein